MSWTIDDARALYSVERWSEGLFDIGEDGHVHAHPLGPGSDGVKLDDIVDRAAQMGYPLPILIRFKDILRRRVDAMLGAFDHAIQASGYRGGYTAIYPIKVNQRASVLTSVLDAGQRVGLEAGSKPELLAVLAMSRPGGVIICNGYKDEEYIRMALIGRELGLRVYIVVEKLAEVPAIIRISQQLGIAPALGVRLRLASIGYGKWQNTGGDKAKFGLSAGQLLEALDLLRAAGMDECLELLHFHMGSQISNLADIQLGVAEAGRYFQELGKLGVRPRIIDVGGGLAVDYEGAGSRGYFSMNYHVEQYAAAIVEAIGQACDAEGLPHPDLMTESGRALTAHHAVLVAEVTAEETPPRQVLPPGAEPEHASVAGLRSVLDELDDREPRAQFEQARYYFSDVKEKFVHGLVSLGERAAAESVFFAICEAVQNALHVDVPGDRELGDELRRLLADKYFCNFSIFRSLPDIWAIDQVFPILPVSGHGSRPEHRAIIEDLTCDSDGRIDQYVEADGVDATLPVHGYDPDARYLLAVFLVGAYQEILGDDHNLFGRTHSLDLTCSQDGWTLHNPVRGDDAAAVLADVGFQRDRLLGALEERIVGAALDADRRRTFLEAVHHSLDAYTYLTTDDVEKD